MMCHCQVSHKLCDAGKLQNDIKSSKDLASFLKVCVLKQYVDICFSVLLLRPSCCRKHDCVVRYKFQKTLFLQ